MSENSLEQLFSDASLSLATPENAFSLPSQIPGPSDWLPRLSDAIDRKIAYFDEVLSAFLILRVPHSFPDAEGKPPNDLVTFLTFLQVGFDASYISPRADLPSAVHQENQPTRLLGPPPAGRPGSKPRPSSPLKPRPPSSVPPQTPNPTPQMEDSDKKYAVAEGIQLHTFIWGDAFTTAKDARKDEFAMIWDADAKEWVLIYRMDVTIAYLKTRVPDPLLCLTVSITLREKPLVLTPARQQIFDMLVHEDRSSTPTQQNLKPVPQVGFGDLFGDLEEVNLLDGLSNGTTFRDKDGTASMQIPSTRLGSMIRRQAYWLPPVTATISAPAPSPTSARTSRPILRKAFRKTLSTCNGFQVRMRTIFVPYFLLPGIGDDGDERREAGGEERSVVLCVEIENTGESSKDFEVGSVKVSVSGEGASSQLISWGESLASMEAEAVFPLRLRPMEQYNLLYSVTFLHPIDSNDPFQPRTTNSGPPIQTHYSELQRSVSILINGRPSEVIDGKTSYLTDAFNSKWSCLLNLSPDHQPDLGDYQLNEPLSVGDAVPTPASPFPVASPRTQVEFERNHPIIATRSPAIGGSKRHTLAGLSSRRATIPSPIKVRFSLPAGMTAISTPSTSGPKTAGLPSIALNSPTSSVQSPGTPTTAGIYGTFPATPAYPAWPAEATAIPPTPYLQAPMMGQASSMVGKVMEPRRMGPTGTMLAGTPGSGGYDANISERLISMEPYSEPVVVSVALLSPAQTTGYRDAKRNTGPQKDYIYPLDIFALEIFVFNQSPVTRRFEVSLPDRKRHRKQLLEDKRRSVTEDPVTNHRLVGEALSRMGSQAGIIPLENRIRIGPLRPETCQSVRMQFMALRPGLHAVDTLTITDTEAEFSLNLRSVMDVVVRDPF